MKKRYYNSTTSEWYYEGTTITRKVEHGIFSGYPTEEHLKAWGFEELEEHGSTQEEETVLPDDSVDVG